MRRLRSIDFRSQYQLLLVICWLTVFPFSTFAQVGKPEKLASPLLQTRTVGLRSKLAQTVSLYHTQTPLKQVFDGLGQQYDIPIWLDRRVDKSVVLDAEFSEVTLAEAIAQITQTNKLSIGFIEGWLYIAPDNLAEKIEAAYWTGFQWANVNAPSLLRPAKLASSSAELVSVDALLSILTEDSRIVCDNPEILIADVWENVSFAETSHLAAIHLLLAGFSLEPDFSIHSNRPASFNITSMPQRKTVDAFYNANDLNLNNGEQWTKKWPNAVFKKTKSRRLALRAPIAAHKDLLPNVRPPKRSRNPGRPGRSDNTQSVSKTALSGALQGSLIEIMTALRSQLKLKVEPWPIPENAANKRISLQLDQTQIDDLLQMISEQADIPIIRNDTTIKLDL